MLTRPLRELELPILAYSTSYFLKEQVDDLKLICRGKRSNLRFKCLYEEAAYVQARSNRSIARLNKI